MARIVFDLPGKKPDTNQWDLPPGISRVMTEGAPVGKMLGDIEDPTGFELWDDAARAIYFPPPVPPTHRTRVRPGEVIALLKDPLLPNKGSYAKIFRAAYPQGNKPEDDIALEFLEQAKFPYSDDGMIDVADIEPALDYFLASPQNYIDADDKARVMQGWPL